MNEWKYQRFGICEEYEGAVTMPPPYTPLVYLLKIGHYIYKFVKGRYASYNPDDPDTQLEDDLAGNESRILKWKEHVLESLMKEASITYCQKRHDMDNGLSESNLRNVVNDVAKPLRDKIAMLDLQNKCLQNKQEGTVIKFKRSTLRGALPRPSVAGNSRRSSAANSVGNLKDRVFKRKRNPKNITRTVSIKENSNGEEKYNV